MDRKDLLFPKATFSILTIIIVLACAIYFSLFNYNLDEQEEYRQLMIAANTDKAQAAKAYTATQQHRRASKDLWFNKNEQRLHLRVRSDDAEVVLDHHDDTTEVVEHMKEVKCLMQEELFYLLPDGREVTKTPDGQLVLRNHPNKTIALEKEVKLRPMQLFRYMEADRASYYYQSDHFIAEDVKVSQYVASGHVLPELVSALDPSMSGIAKSVEFTIKEGNINFSAYRFKASLRLPGGT